METETNKQWKKSILQIKTNYNIWIRGSWFGGADMGFGMWNMFVCDNTNLN